MGAIIGSACALEIDCKRMLDIVIGGSAASLRGDYTLPVLPLYSGAKISTIIGRYLLDYRIEDFWLPFFSVSASLRHARMAVHRRGDAVRSVLPSCRVPIMFPPLPWNGDLLVDGGLVNNIPTDVMRATIPGGTVFGVDVAPRQCISAPSDDLLAVSGWKLIRRHWSLRSRRQGANTMMDVLGRAIRLGGVCRAQSVHADTDCYLTPPLGTFRPMDFSRGAAIAESAYVYALKALGDWLQHNGRPWDTRRREEQA
jgi:predicted acylesterase/phospholipase RssA